MAKLSPINKTDFPMWQGADAVPDAVYLDSAATAQKPQAVIDALVHYYTRQNANVHRGVYTLAEQATEAYENARQTVADFIHAEDTANIIFTRGTTESLNWIAQSWGGTHIQAGDEIIITIMEHHSNLVPWQQLALRTGAKLRYVDIDDQGLLDMPAYRAMLSARTKIVAVTQVSNVLGTINPIQEIGQLAHAAGAILVVDGAQSAPHMPVDVQALGADFFAFSGHKMLGPTGIGVLYGKMALLEAMPPIEFGGEMISKVEKFQTTWADIPWRFEGGTPNIAGAIGLAAAIRYLQAIGLDKIRDHERALTTYALDQLKAIPGLTIYGPQDAARRGGVIAFTLNGVHPHDLATVLDTQQVAVRAGHHCAQPLMQRLGVVATARASFYLYNGQADVDRLVAAVNEAKEFFQQ
ncbi:SufS family cysteine desulfurase [Schleiferilactobacillus harbinensis]|uniref:cysteine desulfurase n=2 Tax=Schleiferilactobacillus harbinensis TaxID=304207 RepID=A0A0R1XEG6_9LACO|nr:cysteine desulfurase [Schleiferilactobacillus harbinensis]KRM28519.1 cysteine desulfurase, SufS subfamily protein [Schleiferilactobacillus harbinensis DSM 16991]QFR64715.1 SufS family cysteine desulfurase [Schleiferilactobacillus harbinensis]